MALSVTRRSLAREPNVATIVVVTPSRDIDYYRSSFEMGATASAVTVAAIGVVGLVVLFLIAVGLWREARVRARAAKAAEEGAEQRKLAPGVAVVHGQVEADGGPAMRVVIHQRGEERGIKGGARRGWVEVGRTVEARPFRLLLDNGERVYVEPGEDALLVDLLGVEPARHPGRRNRTAELRPGDFVYASGRLVAPIRGAAYRSTEQGFTLRPEPGQRMLLSVEPLETRFLQRASLHGKWALAFAAALLVTNSLVFGSYWQKLLWGHVVEADVTRATTWTTEGREGSHRHYGVTAAVSVRGRTYLLNPETNAAFFEEARSLLATHESVTAPILIVLPELKPYNLGERPALNVGVSIFASVLFAGLALAYWVLTLHYRPWYERRRVFDGGDPLASPKPLGNPSVS
jgi:hypothetical protein